MFTSIFSKIYATVGNFIVTCIGKVSWDCIAKLFNNGKYYKITKDEQDTIRKLLTENYYIILTRRNTHLSTYAINLTHLVMTGRLGWYNHALMNMEDTVKTDDDFRLIEATGKLGVSYDPFDKIFDCDSVVLLKPKTMSADEWTHVLEKANSEAGKPYDTLYELADDTKLSCVELVRVALMAEPNYKQDFANFEALIAKSKNLDPHMFYECPDFEVVWESRHK